MHTEHWLEGENEECKDWCQELWLLGHTQSQLQLGVREVMAGIIGQLTANARKRKDTKIVASDKCMYYIPEFQSTGFNPYLHNKYLRNRARIQAENEQNQAEFLDICEFELVGGLKKILLKRGCAVPSSGFDSYFLFWSVNLLTVTKNWLTDGQINR